MNHLIDEFLMVGGAFLLGTHVQASMDGKPEPLWKWLATIFSIATGIGIALSN